MTKTLKIASALLFAALLVAATPAPAPPAMNPPTVTMAAPVPAPPTTPAPAMAPVSSVSVMAVAPAAPAAPKAQPAAKKDSLGSVVGGAMLQILIGILTIALPIVLTPVVLWLLKKMKVENLQTQQAIDDIVDKAVIMGLNYANEHAHKLRDNPVSSAEKLNVATDKAMTYLKDSGIVGKGAEYIKDLIESKLGETRASEAAKPAAATPGAAKVAAEAPKTEEAPKE